MYFFHRRNGAVQVLLRFFFTPVVLISMVAIGLIGVSKPASAITGYHVIHAVNPVHAYTGPSPNYAYVQDIPAGSELNISCQGTGYGNHGTNVWDLLTSGNWISNYYASTESLTGFSPYLARCPGHSPNREFTAFSRAAAKNGLIYQEDGITPWAGWCARFVATLYGLSKAGYKDAATMLSAFLAKGMIHTDGSVPPLGALVFYNVSLPQGHVAFSMGNGTIMTTPFRAGERIYRTTVNHFNNLVGWAYPPPNWGYA